MPHQLGCVLLLITIYFETSYCLTFKCDYDMKTYNQVGSVYTCAPIIDDTTNDILTTVSGCHMNGKNNTDVLAIQIDSKDLIFFPRNVEAFFPHIIVFDLTTDSISTISNHHLIPFPRLVHLQLSKNQITSIEGNLFSGLSFLKYISFTGNKVDHVGLEVNFPNTGEIYFENNTCVDMKATNPIAIYKLRLTLLDKCSKTIPQIETILESRWNIRNINGEVQRLTKEHDCLAENIGIVKENHTEDHNALDAVVRNLKSTSIRHESLIKYLEVVVEYFYGLKTEGIAKGISNDDYQIKRYN